jgi:hypothetical protein
MPRSSARPYWFYRCYCLSLFIAWNLIFGYRSINNQPPGIEMLILFPLFLPAIFWIMSAAAFHWPYSKFGLLECTAPPDEPPIAVADSVGGEVGWCRATFPFMSWAAYPEGISVSIWLIGKGYIPFSEITRIKPSYWGSCKIFHTSREVRSPLFIPAKNINTVIRERWTPTELNS